MNSICSNPDVLMTTDSPEANVVAGMRPKRKLSLHWDIVATYAAASSRVFCTWTP